MAKTITINISNSDQTALEHDLLDIEDWVQGMVDGKINSCKKRMNVLAVDILKNDPTVHTMPATEAELVSVLLNRPDYQNRSEREVKART